VKQVSKEAISGDHPNDGFFVLARAFAAAAHSVKGKDSFDL
jgi:hypothetical protein